MDLAGLIQNFVRKKTDNEQTVKSDRSNTASSKDFKSQTLFSSEPLQNNETEFSYFSRTENQSQNYSVQTFSSKRNNSQPSKSTYQSPSEIADTLKKDIYAKNAVGLPTTGKNIKEHVKQIDCNNVDEVLKQYKEKTGNKESLISAIFNETGLSSEARIEMVQHIENALLERCKNMGIDVSDIEKQIKKEIQCQKDKNCFQSFDSTVLDKLNDKLMARMNDHIKNSMWGKTVSNEEKTNDIVEALHDDINAKNSIGIPTTGKNIEKHCKLINETNVLEVLKSYELLFGESLEDAINNEVGLDKNIKKNLLSHITKCVEKAENYNSHQNKKSEINNKYYSGNRYNVVQNGDNMTIINQDTGEKTIVDLEKICKGLPIIQKIRAKKAIQNLPAEVIIDMSKEVSFDISDKLGAQRSSYDSSSDKIDLGSKFDHGNSAGYTLVHETGHALDYMGYMFNTSSVADDTNFMKAYNTELQAFLDAGNEKYEEKWNPLTGTYSDKRGKIENYVTWNEREMFAECYTLLMTGSCTSKNCILTYFPKTLEAAKQHLDYIRTQKDSKRH